MITIPLQLFIIISGVLCYLCRKQIINPCCHGFYRYFVFEGILYLMLHNIEPLSINLFSIKQLIVAIFLIFSLYFLLTALHQLRHIGGTKKRQHKPDNFSFENTEQLVTLGIYKYVRHPMYTSLLLLNGGIYWQNPTLASLPITIGVSVLVLITAKVEEAENIAFFGTPYIDYKQQSKMLIPYVF